MTTMLLNGLPVVSVKLWHPWQGAWVAQVDFDLEAVPVVPSGSCILTIGTTTLVGTIDPDASGRFGEKARARVVGGAAGWHRNVSARQFHNDAGVLTTAVITATAAEVGEKVVVAIPKRVGVDYERTAGPASRVLAGLDWYVTLAGITTVGPRATLPATPDLDVLSWDAHDQRVELATDAVVMPGTLVVDPRFGSITIRDVEQIFDVGGARAVAWCGATAKSKLTGILQSLVREHGQLHALKTYRYRVVAQNPLDGRLSLQAIEKVSGAPDSIALPPWYGLPGAKSTILPGTEAAVVFLNGDPAQPAVVSFHGGDDLASPVATQSSQAAFVTALVALVGALEAFFNFPGIAALSGGTAQPAAAAAATLATAAALPTNYSLFTKVP